MAPLTDEQLLAFFEQYLPNNDNELITPSVLRLVLAQLVESKASLAALGQFAQLADPRFTGAPQVPTAPAGTNSDQVASTAFVQAALVAIASGKNLSELVLRQDVKGGNWYLTPTGFWEARRDFNAQADPVNGPNWRLLAGFAGQLTTLPVASLSDATDAGRAMLTASSAAAQRALVNNPQIREGQYGNHPGFNTEDGPAGAWAWVFRAILALNTSKVAQPPAAPTAGLVDDTGDTFSFLPNPSYLSFAQYKVVGLPGVTGAVVLDGTNSYVLGDRTYIRVVGAVNKNGLAVYVAGSGNLPDGLPLTNNDPFTGVVVTPTPTPDLTAALAISLATLTLGSSVAYSVTPAKGTAPYSYEVVATDTSTGQAFTLGTAKTGNWTPTTVGSYSIEATVTDSSSPVQMAQSAIRYLQVVQAANRIPVADAGQDLTLSGGTTSLALMGRATDPDGDAITAHTWRYVTGPNVPTGIPANTQNVVVSGLVAGIYQFGYRATDSRGGQSDEDYVLVTVQAANHVPLIKLFGQSNNGGLARRSDLYSATLNTATPSFTRRFLTSIWNPNANAVQRLQVGQPSSDGTGGGNELGLQAGDHPSDYEDGFGPEIGLAQRLEQEGITNAVLAKYAKGATSIKRWLKAANDLYPLLKATIVNARAAIIAAGGTPDEKGMYWDQWETDLGSTTYQADLQQLYNDLLADGLIGATEKFVVCAAQDANMLAQQQAFINANSAARLLTPASIAYIPNDKLHYDARTQLAIGGNSLYNILFNTTGSINISPPQTLLEAVLLHAWEGDTSGAKLADSGKGGQHATQSVANRQPTLVQNALFGRAALSFDQTNLAQYLEIPALAAGANEVTIMVTFQSTSSASGQILVDCSKGRNAIYANGLAYDGANGSQFNSCYYTNAGSGDVAGVRGVNVPGSQPTFMAVAFGTDNGELTVNGDVIGQYRAGVSRLLTNIRLGAAIDAQDTPDLDHNSRFIGLIGGIEIWPGKLTAAQVQARRQVMTGESGGSTPPPTSGAVALSGATISTSNGTTVCSARDNGYGHTGSSSVAFPAGKEFALLLQRTPNSGDAVLGVASAETTFSNMPAGIIFAPGSTDVNSVDGSSIGPRGTIADNGYARIYRAAKSTVLKLQTATDKAGPWTELYTFAAKPTGTLYPVCDMKGAASANLVGVEYLVGS